MTPSRRAQIIVRRIAFLVPVIAQAALVLVSLPPLINAVGGEMWSRLAVGQAIGGFAGTVVALGWGVTGPAQVASVGSRIEQVQIFTDSIYSKAVVGIPVFAGSVLLSRTLAPGAPFVLLALACLSTAVMGLAPTWFFVGCGDGLSLVLLDTVPRIVPALVAWGFVGFGADPRWGFGIQAVAVVGATGLCWMVVTRGRDLRRSMPRVLEVIRDQRHGLATQVGYSAFMYSALPMFHVVGGPGLPVFAIADRVQKQLVTAAIPLGNVLVARLPQQVALLEEPGGRARFARARSFDLGLIGFVCAMGAWMIGKPLIRVLSHGQIAVGWLVVVLLGLTLGAGVVSLIAPTMLLGPLGLTHRGGLSAVAALVAGLPVVAMLGHVLGASGAQCGVLIGYIAGLLVQAVGRQLPFSRRSVRP